MYCERNKAKQEVQQLKKKHLAADQKGGFPLVIKELSVWAALRCFLDSLSCHVVFEVFASEWTVYLSPEAQVVWKSILVPPSTPHVSAPFHLLSPH